MTQAEQAELLRSYHAGPPILVLPNAWDVASALVLATLPACRAIATTSSGVAAALGYPDGEAISRAEMLGVVERIARAVHLPVTADLEAGYGSRPEDAAATAESAVAAGVAGLNLEDGAGEAGLFEVSAQVERIAAAVDAGRRAGVRLVLNARIDVYLDARTPAERLEEAIRRGRAYLDAGADCVFVIGVTDRETIAELARQIPGPLNVLAEAGTPPAAELEKLGVARVSVGSGLHRVTLPALESAGRSLLEEGRFDFLSRAAPSARVQELLRAAAE